MFYELAQIVHLSQLPAQGYGVHLHLHGLHHSALITSDFSEKGESESYVVGKASVVLSNILQKSRFVSSGKDANGNSR